MCKLNSELKTKHKDDFEKVSQLVNIFDPCGFIHFGAPPDEYDCLTNNILSLYYTNKTREEIKTKFLYEIEHHFGTPDLTILTDPYKTEFYNDLDSLLDKLEQQIERKPSH